MLGYVQDLAEIEHLQQMKPQPRKLLIPKLNPGWLPLGRFLCGTFSPFLQGPRHAM